MQQRKRGSLSHTYQPKAPRQGTGLGPCLRHTELVRSHGGSSASRANWEGTTFSLILPAAQGPSASERPPASTYSARYRYHSRSGRRSTNGKSLFSPAKESGLQRLAASGGQQALELLTLHRNSIDLVILDMIMPDMNGPETYKAMREIQPSIRVLFCTGYTMDGNAQEIFERSCSGIIQKPFDAATLSAMLGKILGVAPFVARAANMSAE